MIDWHATLGLPSFVMMCVIAAVTLRIAYLELESAMNFSQALTYLSTDLNHHGQPHQWFHYVTVARPDGDSGAASATILSLAEAVAYGVPKGPVKIVTVSEGGTEAALEEAQKFLDDQHTGLIKHVADPQPHG